MDWKLFNAILAMDSYNRGYNQGIFLGDLDEQGQQINNSDIENAYLGLAKIVKDSAEFGGDLDESASFYAVAYDVGGAGTIIAYRGTDNLGLDTLFGYSVGGGVPDVDQGALAFSFYRLVADNTPPRDASISVTGHSLGGGLAGLVGATFSSGGHHSYIH